MKVTLRPEAVADLKAARQWYDEARSGLGEEFIEAIDVVLRRLVAFPLSAPRVDGYPGVRRAPVRRFPFGVFYLVREGQLIVLRVLHAARGTDPREVG